MIKKNLQDLKGLVAVSNGDQPPDLIIEGASVLDVFTGELFPGDIWVYGNWIAYVGEKKAKAGGDTVVTDATGLTAVPGYIDAHGHSDLYYNPATFSDVVVTRGATTVFSDAHDMINSIGLKGFLEVLSGARRFNIKYLWGVPATYPPYPEVEGGEMFSLFDIWSLFSHYPECASVSELSPYMRILKNEDEILERVLLARSLGKNVEGHTLGASFDRLNTLVAAGITSCHESIRAGDLKNRIRLGLYTMVRHSSIRSDFEELCPVIKDLPVDTIILVTDGIFADDLMSRGYMDHVISGAINNGLSPANAIRMATINPARYFRLDYDVGSLAPGRIADILLLEDLSKPTPVKVFERGSLAAEAGLLKRTASPVPEVGTEYNPYTFSGVSPSDFLIERPGSEEVPVIDIVDRTVTKRMDVALPRKGDIILPDRENDIRKIAYTRREHKKWGYGFVRGIGAKVGAIATTVAHETHGLLVFGLDDDDMALAVNTVLDMKGGIAIADGGKILHTFALPFGGTMSLLPVAELGPALKGMNDLMRSLGSTLDDPLWTMGFLTFTSIVELRLTVSGVYDVRKGKIVF